MAEQMAAKGNDRYHRALPETNTLYRDDTRILPDLCSSLEIVAVSDSLGPEFVIGISGSSVFISHFSSETKIFGSEPEGSTVECADLSNAPVALTVVDANDGDYVASLTLHLDSDGVCGINIQAFTVTGTVSTTPVVVSVNKSGATVCYLEETESATGAFGIAVQRRDLDGTNADGQYPVHVADLEKRRDIDNGAVGDYAPDFNYTHKKRRGLVRNPKDHVWYRRDGYGYVALSEDNPADSIKDTNKSASIGLERTKQIRSEIDISVPEAVMPQTGFRRRSQRGTNEVMGGEEYVRRDVDSLPPKDVAKIEAEARIRRDLFGNDSVDQVMKIRRKKRRDVSQSHEQDADAPQEIKTTFNRRNTSAEDVMNVLEGDVDLRKLKKKRRSIDDGDSESRIIPPGKGMTARRSKAMDTEPNLEDEFVDHHIGNGMPKIFR
eukprot:Clim_evm22s233 gene=Clim_evmTU22s233